MPFLPAVPCHRRAWLAPLALLLAATAAQAAPIQLNYTASFSTCNGPGCTQAIAQADWGSVSGSFIYDPARSTGSSAPPNGYGPDMFSSNLVHHFTGLDSFSATLQAGSLQARSTGLAFTPSPASPYNGIGPGSGAIAVINGQQYRQPDRLELRDQSMNNITGGGLPAGWTVAPSPYSGGVGGRLGLTFAWEAADNPLTSTDVPLDIDSLPGTLRLQGITFGFYWSPSPGQTNWIDYTGRITSFSTAPYVAPPVVPPTTPPVPGGPQGVPEPGTLALAALALAVMGRRRKPV